MDFNDTPEQAKFRKTCREWLEKNAKHKDNASKEPSFLQIKIFLKKQNCGKRKNMMLVGQCCIGQKNMEV